MGWSDAAYNHFNQLCKLIQKQHQTEVNKEFESAYLAWARIQMAGGGTPSERPMGPAWKCTMNWIVMRRISQSLHLNSNINSIRN
jgi:hypothetical protein